MIEAINAIQGVQGAGAVDAVSGVNAVSDLGFVNDVNAVGESNFFELMGAGIEKLDQTVKLSDKAMTDYILKKDISTHELMIAMEQAKHSLQVTIEIRNRLVESYRQITQMQV